MLLFFFANRYKAVTHILYMPLVHFSKYVKETILKLELLWRVDTFFFLLDFITMTYREIISIFSTLNIGAVSHSRVKSIFVLSNLLVLINLIEKKCYQIAVLIYFFNWNVFSKSCVYKPLLIHGQSYTSIGLLIFIVLMCRSPLYFTEICFLSNIIK